MGRHKYDINRRAFGWTPSVQPTEDPTPTATTGEGVFDVAKDLMGKVGIRAVNKLAKESGSKIGKKIVGRTHDDTRHLVQPEATETTNAWEGKEIAGDRIREILEANSLERKKTPPSKKGDKGRLGHPAARAEDVAETEKVNEVISRLLAEED